MALDEDVVPLREETPEERVRSRRRARRVLVSALVLLGVVAAAVLGGVWWLGRTLTPYERIPDAFDIPETARPQPAPGEPAPTGTGTRAACRSWARALSR